MTELEIKNELFCITSKIKEYPVGFCEKNEKEQLTGEILRFGALDMLYLFLEIQKRFNIKLHSEDIDKKAFGSINSIVGTLKRNLPVDSLINMD